ncbi:MAG: TetR/AcrR family transcriptional regulator [Hyphomicrobiaceae bacterium]|nr:TetR/AcrR family transcriptional regulator [Hyphomicrobiaceae bacterium]
MRETLLQLAEEAALEKSFANISLDELAAAAGISKSGFLYHFKSKNDLGLALVQRCTERQMTMLDNMFLRADDLHNDPLHSYLIAIKLFSEMIENDASFNHGFLVNAYTFQDQYHIKGIREIGLGLLERNRGGIIARLKRIAKVYPPREDVDIIALAEMTLSIVEGGMIISALLDDRTYLPRQLDVYRNLIARSFSQP